MRAVAVQYGNTYLLMNQEDPTKALHEESRPVARTLDLDRGILFRPFNAHSLLARGDWQRADLDDAAVRALIAGHPGLEIEGPGLDEPWVLRPSAREARERAERAAREAELASAA